MSSLQENPTKKMLEQRAQERRLAALTPVAPPAGRPFYDNFDSYVADYPEGERFRTWLTSRGCPSSIALFLGTSVDDNALPGHYLWASVTQYLAVGKQDARVLLALHDNDDGLAVKVWPVQELAAAEAMLAQMKELAPFSMWDAIEVFQLQRE